MRCADILPAVCRDSLVSLSRLERTTLVNTLLSPLVSLKLLGSATAQGPDGPLHGRATRGRRLALLGILASSRGRPTTREKLLSILWPDTEPDRARPLLSDSVYIVRNSIGDDAIITSGDELRLNPERIASDCEQFERLVLDRQYALAVAEYGGPFLDGFHLSDAPEFERWADAERARLARLFGDALSELAAASERSNEWASAVSWLQKLAAHDPYSGQIALRLMRALHAAGNRAGALQHARIHATLLREEFGAEPDKDVAALAERIKNDTTTSIADSQQATLENRVEPIDESPLQATVDALPNHFNRSNARLQRPFGSRTTNRVVVVVAVFVAVLSLVWQSRNLLSQSSRVGIQSIAPERSIAVLPFANLANGEDNPYFSDGLTEEIIGLLGRVSGLRVAARSSSFALRNAGFEARRLGDTLRVATVLEGSVRRAGNDIRVTAQLVDVASGYQIWSKSYDRKLEDVIALQNEIAAAIVSALELELDPQDAANTAPTPHNPEVYDLYLRGIFARNKLTRDGLYQAVDYFDRAIRLDSSYAPAYAGKASALGPMMWFGYLPRAQGAPEMHAAAERAVVLDEQSPDAHVARGMAAFYLDWNWTEAEREFRHAITLNPNDSHAHHFLANLLKAMGRFDEAIAERQRALRLDPLSVRMGMQLGADYLVAGKLELAAEAFRRTSELEPLSPVVLGVGPSIAMGLGHVFERQGKPAMALKEYLRIDSLSGVPLAELSLRRLAFDSVGVRGYWRRRAEFMERGPTRADPVLLAWMWARVGNKERTIQNIERAYRERSLGLVFVAALPELRFVHDEPRVAEILRDMRLTPCSTPSALPTSPDSRGSFSPACRH